MDEGLSAFLQLIPGVSRAVALGLAARFETFAALAAASPEDLLAVEGLTPALARRVQDAVGARSGASKAPAGLYICPSCGSFVAGEADRCPHCGIVFDEAEEEKPKAQAEIAPMGTPIPDEVRDALRGLGIDPEKAKGMKARSRWDAGTGEEAPGLYLCPSCGGFITAEATRCPTCGVTIEGEEQAAPAAEAHVVSKAPGLANVCLECGAFNASGAELCSTCGKPLQQPIISPAPDLEPAKVPEGFFTPTGPKRPDRPKPEPGPEIVPRGFLEPRRRETAPAAPSPEPPGPTAPAPSREDVIPKGFLTPPRREPAKALEDVVPKGFLEPRPREEPPAVPEAKPAPATEPAVRTEPAEIEKPVPPVPETPLLGTKAEELLFPPEEKPAEEFVEELPAAPAPPPAVAVAPARLRRERGATRDFARRWKRVSEEKVLEPRARLEEELGHWDDLLRTNPTLERAWHRRAQILAELGRREEAIEAYDRLTQLAPAREEEYRLEALDLTRPPPVEETPALDVMETVADVSPIRPVWEAEKKEDARALEDALEVYERLLVVDPSLTVAWETRAEILRRLGREEEADASLAQGRDLESRQRRIAAEGLVGLQTKSVLRAATYHGRINGLVNGRADGLVNGLGHVNGLSRVFGPALPAEEEGTINGMAAIPILRGVTNGFVNGDGFVDGRRARSFQTANRGAWVRPTASVAMAVTAFVLIPILLGYLGMQISPPGIAIDGALDDWRGVRSYPDAAADVAYAPTDLIAYRVHRIGPTLSAYVQTSAPLFAPRLSGADAIYLFADADGDASTGYAVRTIGADYVVRVVGWNGTVHTTEILEWRGPLGVQDDFAYLVPRAGEASADQVGNVVELQAQLPDLTVARVVLMVTDGRDFVDVAELVVDPATPALLVETTWTAPAVVTGDGIVATLDLKATGGAAGVSSLVLEQTGNMSDGAVSFVLYEDDGDGLYSPGDTPVGPAVSPSADLVPFPLSANLSGTRRYHVRAMFIGAPATASVGLRAKSVESSAAVTLDESGYGASYYLAAPAVTADGAFGDWDAGRLLLDGDDDVTMVRRPLVNQNVDLRGFGMNVSGNVGLYFRVDGTVLGGADIPWHVGRPIPPRFADADRDTVPDDFEEGIRPGLSRDFNNNNLMDEDEPIPDVDGDGEWDFDRGGTDYWLNTTLPTEYGPPYAGRPVTVYIGPFGHERVEGVDTALAYLDVDNRTSTGMYATFQGVALGVDYVVEVRGRAGRVITAGLYAFNVTGTPPFSKVADIATGTAPGRLEAAFPAGLVNLSSERRAVFLLRDWEQDFDSSYTFGTRGASAPPNPLNPGGTDVVINEISARSNPEWFEIANPTGAARNLNGCVLERRQGNNWVNVYTFTQTVGAWGSGSEYLAVNLAGNTLPNGGATLRLRCGAAEIDRTSYPAHSSTQSWARFKNPTTGLPMDSDSDAADFYIDTLPTRGGPNTRHRPTMTLVKRANVATSGPGGTITYTIWYNNTDTGRANNVWINDTLPAQVTFVSSSVPYSSSAGQTYGWLFTNVDAGTTNSFTITVRVELAANGASLVNTATLAYTDQLNRMRAPSLQAWANVTVVRPVISVVKVSDVPQQVPGGFVTYTVFYANTGSAPASNVWINDTLPSQVTFIGSSVPPSSSSGQTYRWVFTNVPVGLNSFTITVQVNANATWGNAVNWVFLNYTSQYDFLLEPSSDDALVYIPEYDLAFAAIVVPGILFGYRKWRRRNEE